MSTAIINLTARIRSPRAARENVLPRACPQDKRDGLGYNRGEIVAAQALSFDFRAGKSNAIAESNRAIGVCGSVGPSQVMATGIKEVR
jgi:hypothetical protein